MKNNHLKVKVSDLSLVRKHSNSNALWSKSKLD